MKQISIFIISLLFSNFSKADNSPFYEANAAYEQGKFLKADSLYVLHIQSEGPSAEAYYNLGNACFKQQQWARAILNYERSLKLNRRQADAAYNLELANLRIRDHIDPIDRSLLHIFWKDTTRMLSSGNWGKWTIVSAWLLLLAVLLYVFGKNIRLRRLGLQAMIAFFSLAVLLLILTLSAKVMEDKNRYAIIMQPSVILKSEPGESSTNLFILHAGLKLGLYETDGDWVRVNLPDGNSGWLPKTTLEEI